jgi:hypothetical protein
VEDLAVTLSRAAMANVIRERFRHAAETPQHADESVKRREFSKLTAASPIMWKHSTPSFKVMAVTMAKR